MSASDDDAVFCVNLGPPSESVLEYGRKHCGENEDNKVLCISDLKDMIYERGDFCPIRMDDEFLLKFLRARNFSMEATYKLLQSYHQFRDDNPEFHENVRPSQLQFIGDDDIMQVLPYRDQNGRRVMVAKMGNWNPAVRTVTQLFQAAMLIVETGALEQDSQILGGICIFDMGDTGMTHASQITPNLAYKIVQLIVTSVPLKAYAIHVVNQTWVFDIIFNAIKPFLLEKMKERIYFHGNDLESLHEHIHPKYLPEKYGGTRKEYYYTDWMKSNRKNKELSEGLQSLGYLFTEEDLALICDEAEKK